MNMQDMQILFVNIPIYLHFHCESLNEPLHLRCSSLLHERIDLSHSHLRTIGGTNVNAVQLHCLFTDVCVTLIPNRHDVKRGNLAFWLSRNLCYACFNSK